MNEEIVLTQLRTLLFSEVRYAHDGMPIALPMPEVIITRDQRPGEAPVLVVAICPFCQCEHRHGLAGDLTLGGLGVRPTLCQRRSPNYPTLYYRIVDSVDSSALDSSELDSSELDVVPTYTDSVDV